MAFLGSFVKVGNGNDENFKAFNFICDSNAKVKTVSIDRLYSKAIFNGASISLLLLRSSKWILLTLIHNASLYCEGLYIKCTISVYSNIQWLWTIQCCPEQARGDKLNINLQFQKGVQKVVSYYPSFLATIFFKLPKKKIHFFYDQIKFFSAPKATPIDLKQYYENSQAHKIITFCSHKITATTTRMKKVDWVS